MKNIFFFDNLITPKILVLFYWLSLIMVIATSLFSMAVNFSLFNILGLIVGCVAVRVGFELIMIAFKNNEYLRRIAESQDAK
ncbi:hypothetical protein ED28_17845 [[Pantoea] beijingensis]|uniref:DUF4282 domain-containing protein n=1 Tax=[Pantoea] beijingensis TaxID=1324864 RepID=A0A443I9K1_9GAMM|nr:MULTISPECIES: DUF4282 domain-containing protein [Erwiniaceae]RWR00723.1 hypothetical protein ED28_17845 [[Pantoea] beijingensis]